MKSCDILYVKISRYMKMNMHMFTIMLLVLSMRKNFSVNLRNLEFDFNIKDFRIKIDVLFYMPAHATCSLSNMHQI